MNERSQLLKSRGNLTVCPLHYKVEVGRCEAGPLKRRNLLVEIRWVEWVKCVADELLKLAPRFRCGRVVAGLDEIQVSIGGVQELIAYQSAKTRCVRNLVPFPVHGAKGRASSKKQDGSARLDFVNQVRIDWHCVVSCGLPAPLSYIREAVVGQKLGFSVRKQKDERRYGTRAEVVSTSKLIKIGLNSDHRPPAGTHARRVGRHANRLHQRPPRSVDASAHHHELSLTAPTTTYRSDDPASP